MRLASSPSISETPSVTISRVRSAPRSSSGAVTRPARPATTAADDEAERRIVEAGAREDGGGIGAEPEERRVPQRDDARKPRMRSSDSANRPATSDLVDERGARRGRRGSPRGSRARRRSRASASAPDARDAPRDGARGLGVRRAHRAVPAREQALRADDQRRHHHRVDDEGADRGDVIFAGDVEHAEQQRAEQRAEDAVRAADGDDDEERHQELDRKGRIDAADDVGGERAAEAGQAAADREGDGEQAVDIDAEPRRDARRRRPPRATARRTAS